MQIQQPCKLSRSHTIVRHQTSNTHSTTNPALPNTLAQSTNTCDAQKAYQENLYGTGKEQKKKEKKTLKTAQPTHQIHMILVRHELEHHQIYHAHRQSRNNTKTY